MQNIFAAGNSTLLTVEAKKDLKHNIIIMYKSFFDTDVDLQLGYNDKFLTMFQNVNGE